MTNDIWSFTGRESELDFIADELRGPGARSVVIGGSAGLGKTRLAREALGVAKSFGLPTHWAAGISATSTIPLGALAHLVPAGDTTSDPLTLLQRAVAAFAGDGRVRRSVVGIDDAHLLDDLSLALVHQLALSGRVALVLSVRTGEPVPSPVGTLWKDGLADRLELQPLSRGDTDRLVRSALGGIVDVRTSESLWRLSRGNPLHLREVIEAGRATGWLRTRGGVWHREGEFAVTARLAEMVGAQMGELAPAARAALEVLAIGEPLPLPTLVRLTNLEVVAVLERRLLITVERSGRHAEARLARPLYGEVVRAQIPQVAAGRLRRELLALASGTGRDDPLRLARLLLNSDEPDPDVQLFVAGAEHAHRVREHEVAERLARAAAAGDGGFRAHLALMEAMHWQGRARECEGMTADAAKLVRTDDDLTALAMVRALNLFGGLGTPDAAGTVLRQMGEPATSARARGEVDGARALLAFFAGRPWEAVELADHACDGVADRAGRPALASAALAGALAMSGRFDAALAAAAEGRTTLDRCATATAAGWARIVLAQSELLALELSGRIRDLDHRAAELLRQSMDGAEWAGDTAAVLQVGFAAYAAGRPRTALRWLHEAAAGLAQRDPLGLGHGCRYRMVQAHALLGDTGAGRALLIGLDPQRGAAGLPLRGEALLAQAWLVASMNRLPEAADLALLAAVEAAERGQWALEARALHVAVRLGRAREVGGRLHALLTKVDGPLVRLYSRHASAAARGAGHELEEVAARFADMGLLLLAAEAAAQAATAHERAGDRPSSAVARTRADALVRSCESVRTPALAGLAAPTLTSREEEVAELAVGGLTNQAIAERLVLSRRTVEAHLANVYSKLGINSRGKLGDVLGRHVAAAAPVGPAGGADLVAVRPPGGGRPRRTQPGRSLRGQSGFPRHTQARRRAQNQVAATNASVLPAAQSTPTSSSVSGATAAQRRPPSARLADSAKSLTAAR
ncbi:LuxR C-terminal-related transcriptional regulator [Pseudonocardia sp. H11422]|uniref:LuxR C-terminal-related transcriptional regulator n=1 Tax=Pseudonocardia sp. H11422 TaxID=2835866 RepID=UPI001BDDC612|nr:LuxR family transcriptional regulator [Pseudonocardia sp. H11422]